MTTTATGNVVLARVASESEPDRQWTVSTDRRSISCDCPGWTRQTHYQSCPAFQGATCTCRRVTPSGPKTFRTCRHLREVQRRVDEAGGLSIVLGLLRAGADLDLAPSETEHLVETARQARRVIDDIHEEAHAVVRPFRRELGHAMAASLEASVEAAIRKFARPPQPVSRPAIPSDRPAWLGGARAILLRD